MEYIGIMRVLFLIILMILSMRGAFAFDVVYPGMSNVTINSPSTFFVGSCNPKSTLLVNGVQVKIHPSGGFAHVVTLEEGENKFVLQNGDELKVFLINRPLKNVKNSYTVPELIEYEKLKYVITSDENVPLRTSPVNFGINRIVHLEKGIPLSIDAEKGEFFRVVLCSNKKAWILKSHVQSLDIILNGSLSGFERADDDEYFRVIFHLDKKVPYEIIEGENFILKFYNIKDFPDNTYVFEFPYKKITGTSRLAGYSGSYDGNDFVFKIRKFPVVDAEHPLKNIKITIDAGHGGIESGATGCLGDKEKDITLLISKYLEHELKKRGADVIMTRSNDSYTELFERVDIANKNDAMFLISIHGNSLPDSADPNKHRGTSIYYYYNQAKPLAANILAEMTGQLGTYNDNIRQGSLALVRNTNALSVLVETAYLINPYDNAMLVDTSFQKHCAKAIADGIEKFLKNFP